MIALVPELYSVQNVKLLRLNALSFFSFQPLSFHSSVQCQCSDPGFHLEAGGSVFHPRGVRGLQSDVGQNSSFQGDSHKLLELSEPILSPKKIFLDPQEGVYSRSFSILYAVF